MFGARRGNGNGVLFFVYILLALYFINNAFVFIKLPEFFSTIDKWILLLGGIFLVLGGINSLRSRRFGY